MKTSKIEVTETVYSFTFTREELLDLIKEIYVISEDEDHNIPKLTVFWVEVNKLGVSIYD